MFSRPTFRIAFTADFYDENGIQKYPDIGLSVFDRQEHVHVTKFSKHEAAIQPEQLSGIHGVIVLSPRVTRESLKNCGNLLSIGRFGVGYDSVDVAACTDAG